MADYSLECIGLGNVSGFLFYREGEAMLVDCGNRGSEEKILEAMKRLGLEPGMLKLLVLTHSHFDHAGSAGTLKELTGCRIMVHRLEAKRLSRGFSPIPPGTRWKAKILVALGRIFARHLMNFRGAEADLFVDEVSDLEAFGFPGQVIHTPGHTFGSMVVLMEGGELIGGDTVFGLEDKQHFPPFAEDLSALVASWGKLKQLPAETFYPAHGRPFSRKSFLEEYDAAMERYG
jgi:glyoxylase-like metal-dependent hydrolase (beta-lactamase superfamily II)